MTSAITARSPTSVTTEENPFRHLRKRPLTEFMNVGGMTPASPSRLFRVASSPHPIPQRGAIRTAPATPVRPIAGRKPPLRVPSGPDDRAAYGPAEILAWMLTGPVGDPADRLAYLLALRLLGLTPRALFETLLEIFDGAPVAPTISVTALRSRVSILVHSWFQVASKSDFENGNARGLGRPGLVPIGLYVNFVGIMMPSGGSGGASPAPKRARGGSIACQTPPPLRGESSAAGALARALTRLEFGAFRRIELAELFGQAWNRADAAQRAPRLRHLIAHANRMTTWLQTRITAQSTPGLQAHALRKAIAAGHALLDLGNYLGAMEVLGATIAEPVRDLHSAWARLTARELGAAKKLEEAISPARNAAAYRARIARDRKFVLPQIALHLNDISRCSEGAAVTGVGGERAFRLNQVTAIAQILNQWRGWQAQKFEEGGCTAQDEDFEAFCQGYGAFFGE